MPTNPLLPPLRSKKISVPPVIHHGQWEAANDDQLLAKLAESMTDGVSGLTLSQVTSMPDPWGQVTAFLSAWMDGSADNPLRRTIVGEWRGLIGLVALTGWRNLPIKRRDLDLNVLVERAFRDDHRNDDAARKREGIPHLGRVLRRTLPYDPGLLKGSDRMSIFCAMPEGGADGSEVPVGLTLPLTLLAPARNYRNALPPEVTWAAMPERYPLTDPARDGKLTPDERALIAAYVTELMKLTPRFPNEISKYANVLNRELTSYHNDLTEDLPKPLMVPRWSEQVFGAIKDDSYHEVILTIPDRTPGAGPGETLLPALPEFVQAGFNGILLCGGEKNQLAPGKDERSVKIWDDFCLSHWGHAAERSRMVELAAERGYLLLGADALLVEPMIEINQAVLHHRRRSQSFLLPVNPILLAVYTAVELEERITIEPLGSRRFKVSLRLDLKRSSGEPIEIVLSHEYSRDSTIKKLEAPVYCTLWPDFQSDYWHHYYLDISTVDRGLYIGVNSQNDAGITTSGLYNPQALAERLEELRDRPAKIDVISRLARGEFPGSRLLTPSQPPPRGRAARVRLLTDRAPTALYLRNADGQGGLMLTFAAEEQPIVPNDQRWKIAIDYGSSSIAVRMRTHVEPESRIVNLGGMTRMLIGDPGSAQDSRRSRIPFAAADTFPVNDVMDPQLTLLWDQQAGAPRPNRDDLVLERYFVPDRNITNYIWESWVGAARGEPSLGSPEGFHFGMKYSLNDANGDRILELIGRFVRQIALQAGARVVGLGARPDNVEWTTAYSDTMGSAERDRFLGTIQEAFSTVFVSPFAPHRTLVDFERQAESMCIGLYLRSGGSRKPFADADLAVAFDVGGYTTDISVWQRGQPVWVGALALAGQHLLADYLLHHPTAAEQLEPQRGRDLAAVAAYLARAQNGSVSSANTRGRLAAEIVINRDEFSRAVEGRGIGRHTNNADVVPFRSITQFAFSGLLYYIAILVAELGREKRIDPTLFTPSGGIAASPSEGLPIGDASDGHGHGTDGPEKRIYLHFGGRGSRIFRHFMDSTAHATALNDFSAKAKLRATVAPPAFTMQEKQEVAIGLLQNTGELDLSRLESARLLPQGVATRGVSQAFGPEATLYPSADEDYTLERELKEFRQFLDGFLATWEHGPRFLLERWSEFVDQVADEFQVEKKRARNGMVSAHQLGHKSEASKVPIQPGFIVALRVAVREWIPRK
ncbi:MAG: hypothetical protein GC191_12570 [Azospirillum sp.]|nr:hypothetical protein [Azospirillum sp.]